MLNKISGALARGNVAWAELACRRDLVGAPDDPQAHVLMGQIMLTLGALPEALSHFERARGHLGDQPALMQDIALACEPRPDVHAGPRYLLIKSWGAGFWSDLDHVLGQLLVAELTGRSPIVYWGSNSRFRDAGTDNAFDHFFKPTSSARFDDLQSPGLSFFPPKWHAGNLREEDLNKSEGEGSRISGCQFLHRPENVVVSDFHTLLNDLMPWIPVGHVLHGLDRVEVYRWLFQKYIHLQPALEDKIAFNWRQKMSGRSWAAVHVRGSDKVTEVSNLDAMNQSYFGVLQRLMSSLPGTSIFLLTDSAPIAEQYLARFGKKLLVLNCERSRDQHGVHFSSKNGIRLGEQVIQDAWLAARCDIFIGNGFSNVSVGVRHLKAWGPNKYFLLGDDMLAGSNIDLFDH